MVCQTAISTESIHDLGPAGAVLFCYSPLLEHYEDGSRLPLVGSDQYFFSLVCRNGKEYVDHPFYKEELLAVASGMNSLRTHCVRFVGFLVRNVLSQMDIMNKSAAKPFRIQ